MQLHLHGEASAFNASDWRHPGRDVYSAALMVVQRMDAFAPFLSPTG